MPGTRLVSVRVGRVVPVTVGALVDKAALLDRHGVRVTAQRLVSCGAVSDRPQSAAAMLAAVVWSEIGGVSLEAMEDALVTLADRSISGRIQPAGSRRAPRTGSMPTRHHLVCRTCDQVPIRLCRRQGAMSASGRELGPGDRRSPGHLPGPMSRRRRGGYCLGRRVIAFPYRGTTEARRRWI